MINSLFLAEDLYQQMTEHAQCSLPHEAVGLLGGDTGGTVTMVQPLLNLMQHRVFFADPRSQYEAEKAITGSGNIVLAVYHSHPNGGVEPSTTDLHFASLRSLVYVIIALARPHLQDVEIRAFRLVDQRIHNVPLLVS